MREPRMMFGFCLLAILALLAGVIALGHVEEKTSFGLQYILGAISALAGGFCQWAFSKTPDEQIVSDKQPHE